MKIRFTYRKFLRLFLRFTLWTLGLLSAISIAVSLLLLVPSIQNNVVRNATNFISSRTGMESSIGSIHIRFPKTVKIDKILVKDHQADTLLHCEAISIRAALLPLVRKKLHIEQLRIKGVSGSVYRKQEDSTFNFQPILDLFAKQQSEKETKPASVWDISFDELQLENVRMSYKDYHDSTSADLRLDRFAVASNATDLVHQDFDLKKIAISGLDIDLLMPDQNQTEIPQVNTGEEITSAPKIKIQTIELNEIGFHLAFTSSKLDLSAYLGDAKVTPRELNLDTHTIELKDLAARDIDTRINITSSLQDSSRQPPASETLTKELASASAFGEFPWNIRVDRSSIENVNFKLDLDTLKRKPNGMDYKHVEFRNLMVDASDIYFDKDRAGVNVHDLKIDEVSGPAVKQLSGNFEMDNRKIRGEKVVLQTARSLIHGDILLTYPGLPNIGSHLNELGIKASFTGNLQLSEVDPFTQVRQDIPALSQIESIGIDVFKASGRMDNLHIDKAGIRFADSSSMLMNAHVVGLPSYDLKLSFQLDSLISNNNDIAMLVPDSLLPSSFQLPKSIFLSARGEMDMDNAEINADFATDMGKLDLYLQKNVNDLHASVRLQEMDIGRLLDQSILGKAYLNSEIEGMLEGNKIKRIKAATEIERIDFNDYTYKHGTIDMVWENDKLGISSDFDDEFLTANLKGEFTPDSMTNHVAVILEVSDANLQQLNVSDEYFKVRGHVSANVDIASADELRGMIKINDADMTLNDQTFHIEEIRFDSDISHNYTNFNIRSEILDAQLTGNTKLSELEDAFIDHLDLFISLPDSVVSRKDFVFEFDLNLKKPDILTDFIARDIKHIEISRCHAKYIDATDLMEVDVVMPQLDYRGFAFHNLAFEIDSEGDRAMAMLRFDSLNYQTYVMHRLQLGADFTRNHADLSLSIRDLYDRLKFQFASSLTFQDDTYKLVIDQDGVMANYQQWTIPKENLLVFREGVFSANDFQLYDKKQKLWLETREDQLTINFENFGIDNLLNIVESDSSLNLLAGQINGHVDIIEPFSSAKIHAELGIDQFRYRDELIGHIDTEITSGPGVPLKFYAALVSDANMIQFSGATSEHNGEARRSIVMETDISDASVFQPFVASLIDNLKGAMKGRISVSDNTSGQSVNGRMQFNHFNLMVVPTRTFLDINGGFNIDNNVAAFDSFAISDSLRNRLSVDGQVNFSNQNNPLFDVRLKAEEFLLINSPQTLSREIGGKLALGIDVTVQGRKSNLNVNSNFQIRKGTDLMYTMPGKELELITDEGIVEFIDFENEEFQQQQAVQGNAFVGDSIVSLIAGIDLTSNISIDPAAKFSVFIDPNSGDLLQFRLSGGLNYKYNESRQGILNGQLQFEEGHYDLSFYGLVKKRFVFDPGSTVSWAGDVMDGEIDFSARHTVRTNSVGLVSNEIGSDERPLYNQRIPYDVILHVTDKISYPSIQFGIDLPNRYRSTYPTLDSKLNLLNQPNMEAERNKQVFALLVGGTFIPENPDVTEGSRNPNFATTAAANTVSSLLTQQLNQLTGQLIQGFDVDMGVNTFDDYASGNAQTRTQLDLKVSKNLFNNRVSAEVESHINLDGSNQEINQSTAGMTEFAVSYMLTEQGNYRIKAFRENAFNIFDGEIQNSGIAFIFVREFNSFKNLKGTGSRAEEQSPVSSEKEE